MYQGEFRMTGNGPAVLMQAALDIQQQEAQSPETETVQTRFGEVTIYRRNPIIFPNGMLGMPDKFQFCLTSFSGEKLARFKLLQSLDDMQLSFITLPLDIDNPIIEAADLQQAARDLEIPLEQMAVAVIVSVHRESGVVKLSANARAPLLMNVARRIAHQYVFGSSKYDIRHLITF
jgi:flagellar assembly factor FliW